MLGSLLWNSAVASGYGISDQKFDTLDMRCVENCIRRCGETPQIFAIFFSNYFVIIIITK